MEGEAPDEPHQPCQGSQLNPKEVIMNLSVPVRYSLILVAVLAITACLPQATGEEPVDV
jgi:hypothetical protein